MTKFLYKKWKNKISIKPEGKLKLQKSSLWRFTVINSKLNSFDLKKILFINAKDSSFIWENEISKKSDHLMKIEWSKLIVSKSKILSFKEINDGKNFFKAIFKNTPKIIFFWGKHDSCIVPKNIFLKAWPDFFYTSDESAVIYIPGKRKKIFSYEENFFIARVRG